MTHVLVIGIGTYPHLIGGDTPCANPDGMGQLTSPPVSARAVAEWFIEEFRDPRAGPGDAGSVGTVALLISEQSPSEFTNPATGETRAVEPADTEHVLAAIKAWKARGNSSAENRMVFYFCGHGTSEGDDLALLMSDFGSDGENVLNGAIDLRMLSGGMKRCQAVEQVYVIDACRSNSDRLIGESNGFAGQVPVLPGRRSRELPPRLDVSYFATLSGEKAFGRPGRMSLFTDALLRALRGAASDDAEGDWTVHTTDLHDAVACFMREKSFAGEVAGVQVPVVANLPRFELHRLKGDPVVPVYVGCEDPADNAVAHLVCIQDESVHHQRGAADADPEHPELEWLVALRLGRYEFEARLPTAPVRRADVEVRPTYKRVRL